MPLDAEDLGGLLDRYWSVLVHWIGGAHDEAEDIVQSAFIKLAIEDPSPNNCVAWLFTVTKRLAINERLSSRKRHQRESQFAMQKPASVCPQPHATELELQELLSVLDEREREIVVARIWGELTFDEIATVCGQSKATVWRVYQTGIARLRTEHKEYTDEWPTKRI